jgi:sporulation protein YlmC with PRC-barrel domain
MPAPGSALEWEGQTVLDRAGEKIGTIKEIFLVEDTGEPEWALVKIGRLKGHTTLVPIAKARPVAKGVEIDVEKNVVSEAPEIEADNEPSEQQVEALYRHYGIDVSGSSAGAAPTSGNGAAAPQAASTEHTNGGSSSESSNGAPDARDQPVSDLLKQVSEEGSTLVSQEIKLAKAEMADKAKDVGIGAGMFGGAGYVANLAAIALMLTIIFALAEAMPAWLAALIVTVLYAAAAAALALMGKKRIQQAGPPIPEQTVESVKQTIETVKEEAKWGLGQTK